MKVDHSLVAADYLPCSRCHEMTDSDELVACAFAGCNEDYLCPNCIASTDGHDYCLHHFDVLEAAEVRRAA